MARGWTQLQLARHAGISRDHLGRVERGENDITFLALERVARALRVDITKLVKD
jgi:transcriptional regulator with XRE-family HTH domain